MNVDWLVQVTVWEHKCFSLQEGATTAQTALMQCRKEAAASSAAAISTQQLLQQLQEAGSALADSHSSAQKLHQQLQQAQQANAQLKQQLAGKAINLVRELLAFLCAVIQCWSLLGL